MITEPYEFKYAPTRFEDIILNDDIKPQLHKALTELPSMLIYGPPGVGKGTFVEVLKHTNDIDMLKINCSDETSIDNIREVVKSYATAVNIDGKLKYVYLNEVDYLSLPAQALLRDLMESVQSVTRFVLCCNYIHKILPELEDRCQFFELTNPPAAQVAMKCFAVLDAEGVRYNKKTVIEMIKSIWKRRPSVRKALVTLKQNVVDGVLAETIRISHSEDTYKEVLEAMKSGNPIAVRTLLKSHQIDYDGLYSYIFDMLYTEEENVFKKDGAAIKLLGEAARWNAITAIKEVNFMTAYNDMLGNGVV